VSREPPYIQRGVVFVRDHFLFLRQRISCKTAKSFCFASAILQRLHFSPIAQISADLQGEMVDNIESHVMRTVDAAQQGKKELEQAEQKKTSSRKVEF
jgi:SNARE domain